MRISRIEKRIKCIATRSDRARRSSADVPSGPFFNRGMEKRFIGLSDLMRLYDKMF